MSKLYINRKGVNKMKTKILSTVIFSTLLFASMYSEAKTEPVPNRPGVGGNNRPAPSGRRGGEGAAVVRTNAVQQRGQGSSTGRDGLGSMSGRNFVSEQRDMGRLLRNEVVEDVRTTQEHVNANTDAQSTKLSEALTGSLSEAKAVELAKIVNGEVKDKKGRPVDVRNLQASLLRLSRKAQTAVKDHVALAGRLIAFAVTVRPGTEPKDPTTGKYETDPRIPGLIHDMANNAGDAVSWSPQPRSNFFQIVKQTLNMRSIHQNGLIGAFRQAVKETFDLTKDKVMEKFWEIRRECRA